MAKLIIQDTAEILVTNLKTGKIVMMGEAQIAGIEQSISEEVIRGGIGNKSIFMMRSDKEMTLNMTSATFDMDYLSMTQGVEIEEAGTATVTRTLAGKVVDNAGTLEVTLANAPADLTTATIRDADGSQEEVAVVSGKITLPVGYEVAEGETVQAFFKDEVIGRSIELNAAKFSDKYKVEYRTIAYSVENATVHSDIYFIFDEAIPSGNFSLSLESGSAYAPELTFTVMAPIGSDKLGEMIQVPRV